MVKLLVFFTLLGSVRVKAACGMLMKLTPGHKKQKMTSFSVTAQVKFSEVPTTIIINSRGGHMRPCEDFLQPLCQILDAQISYL